MTNRKHETKREIGSRTAKKGFRNEDVIIKKFSNWREDTHSKDWLYYICKSKGFEFSNLESIEIKKIGGKNKADLYLKLIFVQFESINIGISLKIQNVMGYNHIHRENADDFARRFNFSKNATIALLKYCGVEGYSPYDQLLKGVISKEEYLSYDDIPEKKQHREGTGRYYFDELPNNEQIELIENFSLNFKEILEYIIRGDSTSNYQADFLLCTLDLGNERFLYSIEIIEEAIDRAFDNGIVKPLIKEHPSLHMGKITLQRKGGTGGATQLQFKWTNVFPEKKR